jgi:hypothetical protein
MKRILAFALLLMSFGSVALADGSGLPPRPTTKPPKPAVVQVADGSGLPPRPTTKPPKPAVVQVADGSGLPPKPTKPPNWNMAA